MLYFQMQNQRNEKKIADIECNYPILAENKTPKRSGFNLNQCH